MEELKKRIRKELVEARKKTNLCVDEYGELYYNGKASAFAEVIEIIEETEKEGNKMAKKETLKEGIMQIHEKAKQLEEELKDMGLDDVIHEQEMATIVSIISNEIWGAMR